MRDDDMFEELKVVRIVENVDHTIQIITKDGTQFGLFSDESADVWTQRFIDWYGDDWVPVAAVFGDCVFGRVDRIDSERAMFGFEAEVK